LFSTKRFQVNNITEIILVQKIKCSFANFLIIKDVNITKETLMKKNYYLFFFIILFSFSSQSQINLDSGLVAHYPFEGNANDLSTYAFNGTASGETYLTGVYGAPNSSIAFNGTTSSYVDCGADNRGITDTLSISVFVKTTFNGIGDIVSKYDPGSDEGYHFQISLGEIRLAGRDGTGNYRQTGFSSTLINDGAWHHVLGVVRKNTWLLYVDCTLEGAESNAAVNPDISSDAELGIGKDVFNDQKFLDCQVDEVRLYNRELSVEERDSLCATAVFAGIPEKYKNTSQLHLYPNPANDQIAITGPSTLEKASISIYNLSGKLIQSESNLKATPILDISDLEPGNYIIKVINETAIFTEKFVKL